MSEFNLLGNTPRVIRDVGARMANKDQNRTTALKFDAEYFDGPREQGYGGYHYDGRWVPVAKKIIEHFDLKPGDRVLDIGAAKGFLVKDLTDCLPGLEVCGIDISRYAVANCHPDAASHLLISSCDQLPFPDDSFDAALAINTVHNLENDRCIRAIQEIERLAPGRGFVQVDAYRNPDEREIFEAWMLTAKTFFQPDEWINFFRRAGYTGDYFWTILECEDTK